MGEPHVGQVISDRYELLRDLASGGMSTVWVARDLKLNREVAFKLMTPVFKDAKTNHARFEREAMNVAQLQSPHIVQIYDYGVHDSAPYIVMELCIGEDLRTRLKRDKRLSMKAMGKILVELARGLSEAHSAQIVHRDIKPANIFLVETKAGELAKILDFGIAKTTDADEQLTQAGTMVGTPQYMSPEQVRALPEIDHRADLWALGIITFRALTGRMPFRGKSAADVAFKVCTHRAPKPTSVAQDLPPSVDEFMAKALSRNPDNRFSSAQEFAEAFMNIAPASAPMSLRMPAPQFSSEGVDWGSLADPSVSLPTGPHSVPSGTFSSFPPPSVTGVTWDSQGWATVNQRVTSTMGVNDGIAVTPRRQRRGLIVGAIAGLVAFLLVAVVVLLSDGDPAPSAAATAAPSSQPTAPVAAATEDSQDSTEDDDMVVEPTPTAKPTAKPKPTRRTKPVPRPPTTPRPPRPPPKDWDPLENRR